jgi:branched-chain amino acid transport system permease protein
MLGFVEILGMTYDYYNLSLIVLALIISLAIWYFLSRTIWGRLLRAVIFDREISQAMGVNVTAVFLGTFILGTTLGALSGAAIAPTISVLPGIGVEVIVLAFAVVVIGGMGSIPGALIGSILVGVVRAAAVHEFPQAEMFVIYAIMAIVLVFRPEGLFAPPAVRKI